MRLFWNKQKGLDKIVHFNLETKTTHKISPRNSTLGKTKLIF